MSRSTNLQLWVKAEPFSFGAVPVSPHSRLTLNNLKKIVNYAKSKGKSGFPNLSFSIWNHISVNKLLLPTEVARMYFEVFRSLLDIPKAERVELDERLSMFGSQAEQVAVLSTASVPTLQFVLFLFCQHLNKINLRSSLSEEWPMRARSPDLDPRSGVGSRSLDEHNHMNFVLTHLEQLLDLLVEPDNYGLARESASLSQSAVEALGYLISGSIDEGRSVESLVEIATKQQNQGASGFSKLSRTFDFKKLQSWLRTTIGQNPFGISNCISTGKRLVWPLQGEDRDKKETRRRRIATNAHIVPKGAESGNKVIILSQICKQTIGRSSKTLEGSSLKIHRCHNSFLYLLSPLRAVSVEKCRFSIVVLGPVETVIHLNQCEQVTLIAPSRRVTLSACSSCVIHALTPSKILILSGNEDVELAPYHTHYGTLEAQMLQAGLGANLNMWNQPLSLGHEEGDKDTYRLMSPEHFFTFTIPFEIGGATESVPGGLPMQYERSLQARLRSKENWQRMVKDTGLSKDQKRTYQGLVESRFQEWLRETGFQKHLDDLVLK